MLIADWTIWYQVNPSILAYPCFWDLQVPSRPWNTAHMGSLLPSLDLCSRMQTGCEMPTDAAIR
jgi:hypothetical protein